MTIQHGDCLDVMAAMEPESVDAICTDPPYGLGFMGKDWDTAGRIASVPPSAALRIADGRDVGRLGNYPGGKGQAATSFDGSRMQAWHQQWAEAAYRVAKPSAYLLAFGGTRTVHRMTVALEDAGWIIRDMLVWAYASGFPKSKASLKPAWEPIVMARKPGPLRMLDIDGCRIGTTKDVPASPSQMEDVRTHGKFGPTPTDTEGWNPESGRWPANVILTDPIFDGGVEGVVGGGETGPAGTAVLRHNGLSKHSLFDNGRGTAPMDDVTYGDSGTYSRFFLLPKADRADREPVLDEYAYRLHRDSGECVKLSLSWEGVDLELNDPTDFTSPGRAISEDAPPKIPTDSNSDTSSHGKPLTDQSQTGTRSTTSTGTSRTTDSRTSSSSTPSRTSVSTPGVSSETESGGSPAPSAESSNGLGLETGTSHDRAGRYTAAAARAISGLSSSRSVCGWCGKPLPRVGTHPTVKPVDLMRHLVRLVTPSGGVVLDPFLGSGTTAIAAEMEGFAWIGIEREAEYVAIAEARLNGTQKGLGLGA